MTDAAERLKLELARLTLPERAELARFLLDSLGEGIEPNEDNAWDAELARRMVEIEHGTAVGEPAEAVLTGLRAKYS
jgi:putative addiction module component (TIGR02574 family)